MCFAGGDKVHRDSQGVFVKQRMQDNEDIHIILKSQLDAIYFITGKTILKRFRKWLLPSDYIIELEKKESSRNNTDSFVSRLNISLNVFSYLHFLF